MTLWLVARATTPTSNDWTPVRLYQTNEAAETAALEWMKAGYEVMVRPVEVEE